MTCLVILEVTCKPGSIDDLKKWLQQELPLSRGNPGCISIDVVQNQDEPSTLVLVEQWASRPIYETYLEWRRQRGDVEALGALLAEPIKIRFFDYFHV